jgi:hypothetical protein
MYAEASALCVDVMIGAKIAHRIGLVPEDHGP